MSSTLHNDLFSSLISEIKSYSGKDPLLPWLKGIRRMKDCLPPQLLKEKLPRFLQKCAQTFESDRLYRNDLRYLRVWLQLMDFVDDPKALLRTMEMNRIGLKRSLFYQAYALYYEKMKKYEDAEKIYHTGVQNLAEPLVELQKSYEQFLHRMERHKNKRIQYQEGKTARRPLSTRSATLHCSEPKENNDNICRVDGQLTGTWPKESVPETLSTNGNTSAKVLEERSNNVMPMKKSNHSKEVGRNIRTESILNHQLCKMESDESNMFRGDDTVVVKFVDTAIVENSEAEDACHHGLVDPTINMKEAMNAINSMFREPIESALVGRRSHRSRLKQDQSLNNGFEVFVDDSLGNGVISSNQGKYDSFSLPQPSRGESFQPHQESFEIYVDDEENGDVGDRQEEEDSMQQPDGQNYVARAFVFPTPKDLPSETSEDRGRSPRGKFQEDTVVCRFVGSTIMDEPEVENACHHGLVDPTVNLKEAMADINNMFGKPMEFVRANRRKKQDKPADKKRDQGGFSILPDDSFKPHEKRDCGGFSIHHDDDLKPDRMGDYGGFSILPDDDIKPQQVGLLPKSSAKSSESDLFEPTVFTKEAIDDINKMFGMPLDF